MRARITAMAAGGILALAAAIPAHASPRTAFGPVDLCVKLQPGLCITSHGAGQQLTIELYGSGNATITSSNDGSFVEMHNASGLCIREESNTQVVGESGGCTGSDQHEQWAVSGPSDDMAFTNRATGDLMVVTGTKAHNNVWGGSSSNDWHWQQAAP